MASDEPRIVEQDGNVVRIVAGDVEVLAQMTRVADELILSRVSMDGTGARTIVFGETQAHGAAICQ